ncbi:chaperonin 10-like protein [Aspergillus alliaceus]|uniref:chaperonin 10-like protein n=1 Tax=Petromyces alliaceus TaxID=209559 RepID=UPI0012A3DA0A|nr:chaperonin 10-like protein [Aspergillus alliaceus]KAB8237524.1 chaperonin 10-like protein [Aspergillus alliaceus]
MALPKTYRRATFKEAGKPLVIEEKELTLPPKGEILVKVEACGVCHSDVFLQDGGLLGRGFPNTPGHEFIGRVVAFGEGVTEWKIGDRAGGAWHAGHDGTCSTCRRGNFQMCDAREINGESREGGYAEYATLRTEAAVRVPENVDAANYAPILCAGVTVYNGMKQMKIPPGSTVAVQGLGGLGHLAIQYANRFGWRVIAISRNRDKEAFARKLGAHEFVAASEGDVGEQLQGLGGVELVVATAPDAKSMMSLMMGLKALGKLLVLSVAGDVPLSSGRMITHGLSVHGWPAGHALDTEEAIVFTEQQDVSCWIEKFPLEQANEAYEAMKKGTVRFRAVITME